MALSDAQLFGYSENTEELFEKARRPITAGGVDVDGVMRPHKALHAATVAANAEQEEAKRRAREATEKFEALRLALYRSTSSALDMAIGAVGKGTVAAENFQKLRSDIRRARTPEEIAAVSVEVPEGVAKKP